MGNGATEIVEINALRAEIEHLITYLVKRTKVRPESDPVLQKAMDFLKLPPLDQRNEFPAVYLELELLLQEKDKSFPVSRNSFRLDLSGQYPLVLRDAQTGIIFQPSPLGEQLLVTQFMNIILEGLKERFGDKLRFYAIIHDHLDLLQREHRSMYDQDVVDLKNPELDHLRLLFSFLYRKCIEFLGKKADDFILSVVNIFMHQFGNYQGLALLVQLLPNNLLSDELFELLSRDQMQLMFWSKVRELEERQNDLKTQTEAKTSFNQMLKEQKQELDEMLDSAFDAIISIDDEGKVTFWNKRAEEIFGWERYEVLGNALHKFIMPEEYREAHQAGMQRYLRTGQTKVLNQRVEISGLRKDGTVFPVELSIAPIVRSKKLSFTAFIRDLTNDKAVEQELIRARNQAEEANRSKSRFLAKMSHEIRTPLNGILGFADVLEGTAMSDEQREYVSLIGKSGRSLLGLISDILDLSRIEQGMMELRPESVDLRKGVEDLIHSFRDRAEEKGLELELEISEKFPDRLMVDALRYEQVLSNLLSNAIKFTDKGQVNIALTLLEQQSDQVRIRCLVSDTGPGVPEEEGEKLFGSFVQGRDQFTGVLDGLGLGLAISKEIVSLMGGKIDLRSPSARFEQGTDFWFDVNLSIAYPKTSQVFMEPVRTEKGFKVLIVEDNRVNRMLFSRMLGELECEVGEAVDGFDALEKIESFEPDLILMDVQMPGIDGLEVARRIRSSGSDVPIAAISANVYPEDVQRSLDAGMFAHLGKPIYKRDLANLLSGMRFRR
jgi:PAS domain S-box-containing protein